MRRSLIVVGIALVCNMAFGAGIQWSSVNGWLNYANGSTPLYGDTTGSAGCFVQLLWVGPDGLIGQAYYGVGIDGTGVTDDEVVDWAFVGSGFANGDDGWFDFAQVDEGGNVQDSRAFYLRAWSAPASDFANGYVPTAASNLYVNSSTWTWTKVSGTYDIVDFTSAGGNLNTTLSPAAAIPEPAVIGLAFIGLMSLRLAGRKGKKA